MAELRIIEDQIVELDGQSFVNMELRRCVLVFRGGVPPILRDSTFDSCDFRLDGPARNTADFLAGIAGSGPDGMALALSLIGIFPKPTESNGDKQ